MAPSTCYCMYHVHIYVYMWYTFVVCTVPHVVPLLCVCHVLEALRMTQHMVLSSIVRTILLTQLQFICANRGCNRCERFVPFGNIIIT